MANIPQTSIAQFIITQAAEKNIMVTTAESCTGGMIGASLTDIAGSSSVFDRGFITYSNQAKVEMVGVSPASLATHGAVSEQVVREMAEGAVSRIDHARVIAISVSGIAGPDGGSAEKPVGLVWFAIAIRHQDQIETKAISINFDGNRDAVRSEAAAFGLKMIADALKA